MLFKETVSISVTVGASINSRVGACILNPPVTVPASAVALQANVPHGDFVHRQPKRHLLGRELGQDQGERANRWAISARVKLLDVLVP